MKSFRISSLTAALALLLCAQPALLAVQRSKGRAAAPVSNKKQLETLRAQIKQALTEDKYAAARWGVKIVALDSGNLVYEEDADKVFNPASNMKLYTTITALDRLGADFKTRTSLYAMSEPDSNGTVKGDLIFYGRGDGNLSGRFNNGDNLKSLEDLANQLKARGVKRIEGNIIGDDSYFNSELIGYGWEWEDLQWKDGAEISALTIDENVVNMKVTSGAKPGDPCTILLDPSNSYVTIVNNTRTVDTGQKLDIGIRRGLQDNIIEVWGTVALNDKGSNYQVSVHDPALYAANLLKSVLGGQGITVTGEARSVNAKQRRQQPLDISSLKELAFLESIPLSDELKVINKESNNLHAEILLRQLGVKFGTKYLEKPIERTSVQGPIPTEELGASVVRDLLKQLGVDTAPLTMKDGSGLSRYDLVTPNATIALLKYVAGRPYANILIDSLPIGGVDGTLRRRFASTTAANNLHAKTGTISYVNSLSGYVTTTAGQRVIFSIMINNRTVDSSATAAIDAVCLLLADYKGKL
ncbi:MAG TPA: D-alanyl-D-alanine carboxypeptidase/D-alanyl-D-alanine-endopeptidase [Blastocatellia bacterium]|nr:D-alanyl-D-alanine carboxypeptidase/D-alanyl-D-alanine-endopeptidase [Blastocatellia bacterium]